MRPIDNTASDLFQKLRARYSPVTLGSESAESTSDPKTARFFNFIYGEEGNDIGPITISLVDGRGMKVFYGENMLEKLESRASWYNFLRELRAFAKRNMLTFDARDISKSQLDGRDFNWLSKNDGSLSEKDVTVSESKMFGSKRRSYQALESVRMIVQHSKSVDESIPGARSRSIQAIYLERSDGERYKFPYNYLTGARAMARHISEGGTPYDQLGQHMLGMIKEMRDLSKFARMSKTIANEDESAAEIRQRVVERFHGLKGTLGALSHVHGYNEFKENFKPQVNEQENQNLEELRERFTRKIWDAKMEELLPAVVRAMESAEITEAPASVEKMIKNPNRLIVLKRDPAADAMVRNTKFTDAQGLMGFILGDIAARAIGDDMDPIANFAASVVDRLGDKDLDSNDHQLGMLLAKRYIDDIKRMATDDEYADMIRQDPKDIYGAKRKRSGGFHESDAFESWAEDIMPEVVRATEAESADEPEYSDMDQDDKRWDDIESDGGMEDSEMIADQIIDSLGGENDVSMDDIYRAVREYSDFADGIDVNVDEVAQIVMDRLGITEAAPTGTTGTAGTAAANDPQAASKLQQAARRVSMLAKATGMKGPVSQVPMIAKAMAARAAGKMPDRRSMMAPMGMGQTVMDVAASDPAKAQQLTATMKRMLKQDAVSESIEDVDGIAEILDLAGIKLDEADRMSNAEILRRTNELIKMNPQIKNPNLIYPGQSINTPQGAYIVGKGDNLWNISKGSTKGEFVPLPPTREPDPSASSLGTKDASRDPANPVIKNIDVKFGSDDTVATAPPPPAAPAAPAAPPPINWSAGEQGRFNRPTAPAAPPPAAPPSNITTRGVPQAQTKPGEIDIFSPKTTDVSGFKDTFGKPGFPDPTKFAPGDPTFLLRQDATSDDAALEDTTSADPAVTAMLTKLRELAGLK